MMADALGAASAVIGAVSQVYEPLRETNALSQDMDNVHEDLNEAMATLRAKMDDHDLKLKRQRTTKNPSRTYTNWIDRVRRIEKSVEVLNTKYGIERPKTGLLSFNTRCKFTKEMKSKTSEVVKLCEEGRNFGEILVEKEPEVVVKMIAPDIKQFSTLQKPLNDILDFLSNKKEKGIRVHGMLGVGKTTILQNLNNHEKVAEMFEIVIWVKVSTEENNKNLSTRQMQQAIVQRLKLDMEGNNRDEEVALRIRDALGNKKYLLLLDDVREDLELDQIGIDVNNVIDSKIVLTTTVDGVCNSVVDRVIKVERLSEKDALKMFKNILGDAQLENNPEVTRVMVQIVNFCDRLPLVLKTVANAFKMRKTVQCWSDGLKILRMWPERGDGAMKAMLKLLNFCPDNLDDAQKKCFLYSAMYPEDIHIHTDCLLDGWAAEELYGREEDAEMVHVYCRRILEHLKTVSLLEECVRREYVTMHKLIRKAALCKLPVDGEPKHLVDTGKSLREPPKVEHWKEKNWISLGVNRLQGLPELSDSLDVSTLLLQENPSLKTIPDSFFEGMQKLRVLNLYCTGIVSLPSSLSKLIRLKVLYLNGCTYLVKLPSQIGELEDLEVLDIRGSGVQNIPPDMEKMGQLRRLLVSFTNFQSDRETVLRNCQVISRICSLEELVIDVKSIKRFCNEMLNDVTSEVAATLTRLTTLKFCFKDGDEEHVIKKVADTLTFSVPKADAFTSLVQRIDYLDSFQVFIGCSFSSSPQIPKFYQYERYLRYCGGEGCNPTISKVLAKTDAFELVNHKDLENVSEFGTASMDEVQAFLIEGCNKITTIVDASNCTMDGPIILPKLRRLYIKKLPELERFWKGLMHLESLSNLETIDIRECSKIEVLLLVQHVNSHILPNLMKITLVDMPNLTKICSFGCAPPALKELEIHGCPSLTELPFNIENVMNLRSIEAEQGWWEKLLWQDPAVKEQLQLRCSLQLVRQDAIANAGDVAVDMVVG